MIEINQDFADGVLHSRNPETNKNDYGRILCVCGSAGYTGAAYFSAQGAVRMGSGIVTLATPEGAWPVLAVKLNEPVVRPMPAGGKRAVFPWTHCRSCLRLPKRRTRCSSGADSAVRIR